MKKVLLPGLIAGVLMAIAGMIIGQVGNVIWPSLMAEYSNTEMFRAWDDPLMMLFFLYPLILGVSLAWVWDKAKGLFKGNTWDRVWRFAGIYVLVITIPGMLITFSSFQVSLGMTATWTLNGIANAFIAGFIFSKMNK